MLLSILCKLLFCKRILTNFYFYFAVFCICYDFSTKILIHSSNSMLHVILEISLTISWSDFPAVYVLLLVSLGLCVAN